MHRGTLSGKFPPGLNTLVSIISRLLLTGVLLFAVMLVRAEAPEEPWVEVAGKRYWVEIAADPASRARGLMFREAMPDNAGMLFIWPRPEPRAFWMRNTRIPLDIIYLSPDLEIVAWSLDTPPCRTRNCPSYPSRAPAQYVLEVNAGEMARLGARIGEKVRIGNVASITSETETGVTQDDSGF